MKKSIIDLTEMFPNDNLSDYQKENGRVEFTAQARFINGLASGNDFQMKQVRTYILSRESALSDALKSNNSSEVQNAKIENIHGDILNSNITFDLMAEFQIAIKEAYKSCTGSDWVPYVKKDLNQLEKELQTASRIDAQGYLDSKVQKA